MSGSTLLASVLFVLLMTMLYLHHSFLLATNSTPVFGGRDDKTLTQTNGDLTSTAAPVNLGQSLEGMQKQIHDLSDELAQLKNVLILKLDRALERRDKQSLEAGSMKHADETQTLTQAPKYVVVAAPAASTTATAQAPSTSTTVVSRGTIKSESVSSCRGEEKIIISDRLVAYKNPFWENHELEHDKIATVATRNSIKVSTHGESDMLSSFLLSTGIWEPALMTIIQAVAEHYRTTNTEMVFFDIGSNLGLFGLIAASYGHQTYFFEPVPATINHVCESVAINKYGSLVTVLPMGLGAQESSMFMLPNLSNLGASVARPLRSFEVGSDHDEIEIPIAALDDIFPSLHVSPTARRVIKVDAEGSEYNIFQGGMKTLYHQNVDVIFFENSWGRPPLRAVRYQWLKDIASAGFELHCCAACWPYTPQKGRCKPVDLDDEEATFADGVELVALRSHELLHLISFAPPDGPLPK